MKTLIFALLLISKFAYADDADSWIKLEDPSKISCDEGYYFNLRYNNKSVFSQFFSTTTLRQECHAIVVQAIQDSKSLYLNLRYVGPNDIKRLHDILVPEDGYFTHKQPNVPPAAKAE
jgi:hypothetical protein